MDAEVKLCVEILENAIAFEEEGMTFFQRRAEKAPSVLERNLFTSLAKDEAGHKASLVRMRDDLQRENSIDALPEVDDDHILNVRQIFQQSMAEVNDPYEYQHEELEILNGAMEVERRGYHLYNDVAKAVTSERARAIFRGLAAEEQNHYSLLKNTYDYMADPEGFAGFDGNAMLDGG